MSPFHYLFDKLYPLIRFTYERLWRQSWYDPILPNLWLGGAPTYKRDYDYLLDHGINSVVDIRQERQDDLELFKKNDITHLKLPVPDVSSPPVALIEEGVTFIRSQIENQRTVYVHCAKGRGRSATLVAGYLMKYERMSFEEAREFMKKRRKLVKLEARHGRVLNEWLAQTKKEPLTLLTDPTQKSE